MWALVNQFQMLTVLPFLGSYISDKFIYFINDFKFTRFDFSFTSILPFPILGEEIDKLDYEQKIEVLKKNGIESGSYLTNQLQLLKTLILFILMNLLFLAFYFIAKNKRI